MMTDRSEVARRVAEKYGIKEGWTPEPWEVGDLDRNGQRIVRGEHIEIATCWHHSVHAIEREMESNATLIAAAPKLLADLISSEMRADKLESESNCDKLTRERATKRHWQERAEKAEARVKELESPQSHRGLETSSGAVERYEVEGQVVGAKEFYRLNKEKWQVKIEQGSDADLFEFADAFCANLKWRLEHVTLCLRALQQECRCFCGRECGCICHDRKPESEKLSSKHAANLKLAMKLQTAMHAVGLKDEWEAQEKISIASLEGLLSESPRPAQESASPQLTELIKRAARRIASAQKLGIEMKLAVSEDGLVSLLGEQLAELRESESPRQPINLAEWTREWFERNKLNPADFYIPDMLEDFREALGDCGSVRGGGSDSGNHSADDAMREERKRIKEVLQAKFDQINGEAQTYSLQHHDEKAFALNHGRLGALQMLSVLDEEERTP